jgi:hypothetical protein
LAGTCADIYCTVLFHIGPYPTYKKKKNFNVFINVYPEIETKEKLLEIKQKEIVMVFATVLTRINELARTLDYKFNHDLIDNVLIRGLNVQTKTILENKKCKNTTKF